MNEAIKLNPNKAIFICSLGFTQAKIKDYKAAFMSFILTSKIEIKIPETWFNLGILYEICKQPNESIFVLEKSLIQNPDFEKSKERIEFLKRNVLTTEDELIQLMILPEYRVADTIKPHKKFLSNERLKYVIENEMSFIGSFPDNNLFEIDIQPSIKNNEDIEDEEIEDHKKFKSGEIPQLNYIPELRLENYQLANKNSNPIQLADPPIPDIKQCSSKQNENELLKKDNLVPNEKKEEKNMENILPQINEEDKLYNINNNRIQKNYLQSQNEKPRENPQQSQAWNPSCPISNPLQQPLIDPLSNPSIQENSFIPILQPNLYPYYFQHRLIPQPFNSQMCLNLVQLGPQQQMINQPNQQFVFPVIPPNYWNPQLYSMGSPYSYQYPNQINPPPSFRNVPHYNVPNIPSEIEKLNPSNNIFIPNFGFVEEKVDKKNISKSTKKNKERSQHEVQQMSPRKTPNQKVETPGDDNYNKNSTIVKINLSIDQEHHKIGSLTSNKIGNENDKGQDNDISIPKKRKRESEDLNMNIEKSSKKISKKE